ncbi:MAG: hypothetical protein WC717_04855 [Candidatus Micrarchaeia archaeon]|jgi:hypothetical protein
MDGKAKGARGAGIGAGGSMRGQIFSTELMVSMSVFIGALIVFLYVWNSMYTAYVEEQSDNKMQVVLVGISDAAVMSPGDPADWEATVGTGANSYGFASARSVLSPAKLYAMQGYFSANYTDMKDKMGAGGYDIFIDVSDLEGNTYYGFGSPAGTDNSSVSAVTAERLALIGDEMVKLKVQLWRTRGRSL